NIEYWYCPDCDTFFQNEACTEITNAKRVILPAIGSENLQHFDALAAGCHSNGNIEYWYCPDCDTYFQNEACTEVTNAKRIILPATGSENLTHFDALEPTCHSNGNIEYWYCPDCDTYFQNEACTEVTNAKRVILPATGSENLTHFDALEPTCHSNGNIEYWYCPDCDTFFQNEACTEITNAKRVILPATGSENLTHFDALEPTCHDNGNIEYWYCPDCDTFFQNEACTEVTNAKRVILPATGSENLTHFDALEPTCHDNGNVEYWYCPDCGRFFLDEACTRLTNAKSVVLGALGSENLQHVEAVAPTCEENGNVEYWYCPDCQRFFLDENCTQLTNAKSVVLGALNHPNLIHFDALEPTCHDNGNIEYWYCPDCDTYFQDEACTQLTNAKRVILGALGSENLTHVPAKAPTCTDNGNIEYWYCPDCDRYWTDEALTQLTNAKRVVDPAVGHSFDDNNICTECGYDGSVPQTGDNFTVVPLIAAVLSLIAIVALPVAKKKFF
ncbi:MAG: hypothetical protein ACI3W5_06395, partial [Faecousia sp.]